MIHNPLTLPPPDLRHLMNTSVSALEDESMRGSGPSMGRITGSASIETLVRVGLEKVSYSMCLFLLPVSETFE